MRAASGTRTERFLVTGSLGCIGVWVLRELLRQGAFVVGSDLATHSHRLGLVLDDEHDAHLARAVIDVTDMAQIERALDEYAITRIIHLAALQVPFCRADPPLGAAVNVVGTVNVLEAARRRQDRIPHVVYASSIAALDSAAGQAGEFLPLPGTVYGVFKRADEQLAMRYSLDYNLPSIGLRPHTVFGPGRDQGLTSAPTMAMLAAAAGRAYTIPYGGGAQFQYAPDVADAFVAAALADVKDASVHNLRARRARSMTWWRRLSVRRPRSTGSSSTRERRCPSRPPLTATGSNPRSAGSRRLRSRQRCVKRSSCSARRWQIGGSIPRFSDSRPADLISALTGPSGVP